MTAAGNAALQNVPEPSGKEPPAAPKPALECWCRASAQDDDAVEKEAAKGYDIAFVGIDNRSRNSTALRGRCRLLPPRSRPVAIALNGRRYDRPRPTCRSTSWCRPAAAPDARLATEIALTLAACQQGHPDRAARLRSAGRHALLRGRARRPASRCWSTPTGWASAAACRQGTDRDQPQAGGRDPPRRCVGGRFDLVVLGTSLRQGETKFLGPRTLGLVQSLRTPVLLIAR